MELSVQVKNTYQKNVIIKNSNPTLPIPIKIVLTVSQKVIKKIANDKFRHIILLKSP